MKIKIVQKKDFSKMMRRAIISQNANIQLLFKNHKDRLLDGDFAKSVMRLSHQGLITVVFVASAS